MRKIITAPVTTLIFSLMLLPNFGRSETTADRDWLFNRQIELYAYLLKGADISSALRDKLQQGFHRFAFEYWLLSKTNPAASSPWWRGELRERLHKEARNERYFKDPADLMPFFKNGMLTPTIAVVPVAGLEMTGLSEKRYEILVKEFQLVFFDPTNVFPIDPLPSGSKIITGSSEDHLSIEEFLGGRSWRSVSRDRLPIRFQNEPFRAFQLLSIAGRAYYLPAFLRMCERDAGEIGSLPKDLLNELVGDSAESKELRSAFTKNQKECIDAFFGQLFEDGTGENALLRLLRQKFATESR